MTFKSTILVSIVIALSFTSCNNGNNTMPASPPQESESNKKEQEMKSYVSMFEIPATNISRAIHFYQELLEIKIEKMDIGGMQMGILPHEGQIVTGVIIQADGYNPSADGVLMYLNAGENLQVVLDRVEKNGGQILLSKTAHADESGYFAIFLDSEGNKMALNSKN
jgi:predicted enzyme related to lactoylglutathione lyase